MKITKWGYIKKIDVIKILELFFVVIRGKIANTSSMNYLWAKKCFRKAVMLSLIQTIMSKSKDDRSRPASESSRCSTGERKTQSKYWLTFLGMTRRPRRGGVMQLPPFSTHSRIKVISVEDLIDRPQIRFDIRSESFRRSHLLSCRTKRDRPNGTLDRVTFVWCGRTKQICSPVFAVECLRCSVLLGAFDRICGKHR